MTFFSVAEATKLLGIDAKTLHRWLTDAHLPLQSHPRDGRKKGVSEEHMLILARLHHRNAASLCPEPPVPLPSHAPPLPDALFALPETLAVLQAQVAALQQQITHLTHLLTQQIPASTGTVKPVSKPPRAVKPAPQAPRSRPGVAKTPPKPVHVIARVEYRQEGRYVVICPKHGLLPFEPDTPEWFVWVAEHDSFRFVGKYGHFTAHHEWRAPKGAWRAHRQIRGHSYTLRLALSQELTLAVLEQAAEALQAHLS